MRKISIAGLVFVVAVVLSLVVAPALLDVNRYRGALEKEAQRHLGRAVKLGHMRLQMMPLAFRVDRASVGEDLRFGRGDFAQVQDLSIKLNLWPLLHKRIQITSVDLRGPHIEVIRGANGAWNFSSVG